MDFAKKLGENLKDWREGAGLTQLKLAKITGIHQSMISRWEAGTNLPSIRDLIVLADFYHISLDELVDREQK